MSSRNKLKRERHLATVTLVILTLWSGSAFANLKIFACEPEWGALAKEIAGSKAGIYVATGPDQDAHYIRARPSLIAKIRRANLVFCTGASLEAGWLPLLLQRGAQAAVQPGKPGNIMAADFVNTIEKPLVLDRSLGDIHPEGNPHVHLDPRNIIILAKILSKRLSIIDPSNSAYYQKRTNSFVKGWDKLIIGWNKRLNRLKGQRVAVHHRSWSYLLSWSGLREAAMLEEKPGIPPSARHLNNVLKGVKADRTMAILRTSFDDPQPSQWLMKKTGIPAIVLPFSVSREPVEGNLARLFNNILKKLENIAAKR
ncbi:MAG: metal ABC transporter substrate-binding protein [Alphaproteobacteria bacterium]